MRTGGELTDESSRPAEQSDVTSAEVGSAGPDGARQVERLATGGRLGRPGAPLRRSSPYFIGFVGALGGLTAWYLSTAVVHVKGVLVLIVIALFLAVGLDPFVERLEGRGLRRRWAVTVVAVVVLLVFVGFIAAVAQPLASQTSSLISSVPRELANLQRNPTIARADARFHLLDRLRGAATNPATTQALAGGLLDVGRRLVTLVFEAFTLLVLTVYFLAALPQLRRHALRLAPASRRERVQALGDAILTGIGGYVNGMLIVASCAGLTAFVLLSVLGVPYALPLALLVAAADLIPMVGATIGAAVVTAVAFLHSVSAGVVCGLFLLGYQQVENYLLYPRVMRRAVNVPPVLTVVAALLGGALLGVVGALIAIPIAAGVLLIVREVVQPRQDRA